MKLTITVTTDAEADRDGEGPADEDRAIALVEGRLGPALEQILKDCEREGLDVTIE